MNTVSVYPTDELVSKFDSLCADEDGFSFPSAQQQNACREVVQIIAENFALYTELLAMTIDCRVTRIASLFGGNYTQKTAEALSNKIAITLCYVTPRQYPTDARTVKASTYQNMTARAAAMASEYHIADERKTRTGFEIVLRGNDTDNTHTLAVSDYQASCDCRSFYFFENCAHCLALPALHASFSALLNLEIASCEKRESCLIDKDIEKGLAMMEGVELVELQGRLKGLYKCGMITDAISAMFRLHAMAQKATQ